MAQEVIMKKTIIILLTSVIESERSALLAVRVWLRHRIMDGDIGEPWKDHRITLLLPDDTRLETRTDTEGYLNVDNVKAIGMVSFMLLYDTDDKYEVIQPYREPESPAYYKIKENDAGLRAIAAYDFIYGNSNLWEKLYEANKNNFIDDQNPDYIEAGQALIIPPIRRETRGGTR
jgi:hypothetical protein